MHGHGTLTWVLYASNLTKKRVADRVQCTLTCTVVDSRNPVGCRCSRWSRGTYTYLQKNRHLAPSVCY